MTNISFKPQSVYVDGIKKKGQGNLVAIVELSIVPIGTKSTSLSSYVAACLKVLQDSGLTHEVHGMGTIIEGDLEALFKVILKMHEVPFEAGALRVVTSIKIDDRRDKEASAKAKVESVVRRQSQA
ncbi:MAG: MTH1187 family thiamine-binding protein [Desulfobacterales bacterium]|nr:MAG: MTH1187 family thiamine-binding protein [Desulfobacterales bacterium]